MTEHGAPSLDELTARWRRDLEAWAIPDEILRSAPESPWGFPTGPFEHAAAAALEGGLPDASRRRALEALPPGGSVLDVGCGAGAASLPLAPPAGLLVAVDESTAMLDAFSLGARRRSTEHRCFPGRWPDVAGDVPAADVAVCHHVAYNVADLAPFLQALHEHARRRVVLEMTQLHPLTSLTPLWRSIHGLARPQRPSADDALAIVRALGFAARAERQRRSSPRRAAPLEERLAFVRKQLCVGPAYDDEIVAFLAATAEDRREVVTLFWDTTG